MYKKPATIITLCFIFFGIHFESHAQFNFLSCKHADLKMYKDKCVETNCSTESSKVTQKESSVCMTNRAEACFCLTYIGARYHNEGSFKFDDFAIHGNFCGWRNNANIFFNSTNISRLKKIKETQNLAALDELDKICKVHDIAYIEPPIDICSADQKAIAQFLEFAYVMKSSFKNAELAVVMSETLLLNKWSCHFLSWYLK